MDTESAPSEVNAGRGALPSGGSVMLVELLTANTVGGGKR